MVKEVDFNSPPVTEVVFGFILEKPTRLLTSHFGAFWSEIRDKFPGTQDQLPLVNIGETVDASQPLSRVWFVSAEGSRLVQLQHDRFFYNWRRLDGDSSPYPEYENLFQEFIGMAERLQAFLRNEGLSEELRASQFELSYINTLMRPAEWEQSRAIGDLLVDHNWADRPGRFLSPPKDFSWGSAFDLPGDQGQLVVDGRSGWKADNPLDRILQLTLTTKSSPLTKSNTIPFCEDWFRVAHEHIVKGFVDITDSDVQKKVWGKK